MLVVVPTHLITIIKNPCRKIPAGVFLCLDMLFLKHPVHKFEEEITLPPSGIANTGAMQVGLAATARPVIVRAERRARSTARVT